MAWKEQTWVDDDGSLTVGTPFSAERMNNIEGGIAEALSLRGQTEWTPVFSSGMSELAPGTFERVSGAGEWTQQLYSIEGYVRGAFLTWHCPQTNKHLMMGLNSDPTTDASFTSIDYALFCNSSGELVIWENGVSRGKFGTYTTSDIFTITYDGQFVRYWKNGELLREVARAIGGALYFDSSFGMVGAKVEDVHFGPMGEKGGTGATGATGEKGETGEKGKVEVLHDTSSHPTAGTGNLEWTHTPIATLIRGVLVQVVQNVRASSAIQTTKVSYGGVEMTKVREFAEANRMVTVVYFLGDGIPQGAQTVKVTVSGAAKKQAMCHSQTAPGKLRTISQTAVGKAKAPGAGVTSIQEQCQVYGVLSVQANPTLTVGDPTEELLEENLNTAEAVEYVNFAKWKTGQSGATAESNINWTTATEAEYGAMVTTVGLVRDFGLVTALPPRAGEGDMCTFQASVGNGVAWEFVYQGQGITLPWLNRGSPGLLEEAEALVETGSTTFVGLTGGPEVTVPLKGDYYVCLGARAYNNVAASNQLMSYKIGASAATNADSVDLAAPTALTVPLSAYRKKKKLELAKGAVLLAQYLTSGGTMKVDQRSIEIIPIRVG